ncbi:putative phage-related protein [Liberibacter phage FP2]|nr:putative phage-related protein [Liberibacter phage FP2]
MTIKKVLIASTLLSLCGCGLADEPKKLNPDQLCDAVCRLTLEEQKELQLR